MRPLLGPTPFMGQDTHTHCQDPPRPFQDPPGSSKALPGPPKAPPGPPRPFQDPQASLELPKAPQGPHSWAKGPQAPRGPPSTGSATVGAEVEAIMLLRAGNGEVTVAGKGGIPRGAEINPQLRGGPRRQCVQRLIPCTPKSAFSHHLGTWVSPWVPGTHRPRTPGSLLGDYPDTWVLSLEPTWITGWPPQTPGSSPSRVPPNTGVLYPDLLGPPQTPGPPVLDSWVPLSPPRSWGPLSWTPGSP